MTEPLIDNKKISVETTEGPVDDVIELEGEENITKLPKCFTIRDHKLFLTHSNTLSITKLCIKQRTSYHYLKKILPAVFDLTHQKSLDHIKGYNKNKEDIMRRASTILQNEK